MKTQAQTSRAVTRDCSMLPGSTRTLGQPGRGDYWNFRGRKRRSFALSISFVWLVIQPPIVRSKCLNTGRFLFPVQIGSPEMAFGHFWAVPLCMDRNSYVSRGCRSTTICMPRFVTELPILKANSVIPSSWASQGFEPYPLGQVLTRLDKHESNSPTQEISLVMVRISNKSLSPINLITSPPTLVAHGWKKPWTTGNPCPSNQHGCPLRTCGRGPWMSSLGYAEVLLHFGLNSSASEPLGLWVKARITLSRLR